MLYNEGDSDGDMRFDHLKYKPPKNVVVNMDEEKPETIPKLIKKHFYRN